MQSANITLSDDKRVTMREPKVRDIRAVSSIASEEEKEIALISNLTGMMEEEIDDLSLADYAKLQDALSGFMF